MKSILLAEDDPRDAELTLTALEENHLAYKYGANAYVVKPVDFSEFMTAVKEVGVFWAAINEPPVKGK